VKDWASIATAAGLTQAGAHTERIAKTLSALDATFRPLVARLEAGDEPAAVFQAEEGGDDHTRSR